MMRSLRLRLYALGARLTIRPLFSLTDDAKRDGDRLDRLASRFTHFVPYTLRLPRELGGRPALWLAGKGADPSKVILYFHGGAYFAGSPDTHAAMLARLSRYAGYPVFAQAYRLAPKYPFPAAFDDAIAAWDDLISRGYHPEDIIIGGDSAGGGLALALLATLCARRECPAALFAMSPWTDLTMSGRSVEEIGKSDDVIPSDRMTEAARAYVGEAEPSDPRVSPLFAAFDHPPPVYLQIGSPEVLEDDTYRMAERLRKSGGEVLVQTWDGAPHVWHLGELWVPEARDALKQIANFVQTSFDKVSR